VHRGREYPQLSACFTLASQVARARVYFHAEGVPEWYYVEMKSAIPCYQAALLRPSKRLAEQKKRLEYYVEVTSRKMELARTPQFDPLIVASAGECPKDMPVAPFASAAPAAVFPSLPAGFVAGGISTAAIVGAGVALAGGTGAVLAWQWPRFDEAHHHRATGNVHAKRSSDALTGCVADTSTRADPYTYTYTHTCTRTNTCTCTGLGPFTQCDPDPRTHADANLDADTPDPVQPEPDQTVGSGRPRPRDGRQGPAQVRDAVSHQP
jgi:hypothetical protein